MHRESPNSSNHPFEQAVTKALTTLLGQPPMDSHTSFFALGADELTLFRLLNKLHHLFPHIQLSWSDITKHTSVTALSRHMAERRDQEVRGGGDAQKSSATIRERFLHASLHDRRQMLEIYLHSEIDHAINASLSIEETDTNKHELRDQFHGHAVNMALIWAFKRDFQLPIYQCEIECHATVRELAAYFTNELESRYGFVPQARMPGVQAETAVPQAFLPGAAHTQTSTLQEDQIPNVILLLSAPRSGSTLLRLMLGGHSQLFCPPELNLLHHDELSSWIENRLRRFPRRGRVVQNLMAIMGFSPLECETILDAPAKHHITVSQLYERTIRHAKKPLLVDKTPSYAKRAGTLHRAEALFVQPKYIHLVRHPYAMIDSFVRHRFEKLIGQPGDQPHACAEATWLMRNQNILNIEKRVGGERYHMLRYEDLVQQPEETMRELCAFLGVAFEEALLQPYGGSRLLSGPGDYDILQHQEIDPTLANAWENIQLPKPLIFDTAALAKHFGYDITE